MSTDRETTRIVRSWLEDGVTALPDRVLDAVLDQLPATPQRRAGWLARRLPEMNNSAKIFVAAAAVAVAVAVLIGANYLAAPSVGEPGPAAPTLEPTPTATLQPTPTPTPVGPLPEGSHVLWERVPMTVTIPGLGWYGEPGDGIVVKNDTADAPDGAGLIVFGGEGDLFVYGDPCRWASSVPDAPATTVDAFVAALAAQASRDASAPLDVTVGGYTGKSITLHVPDDAVFSQCDQGYFGSWRTNQGLTPSRYHQDPGQIDKVWILDVDGELVVIDAAYYDGTPQSVVDEMEAIVNSTAFE